MLEKLTVSNLAVVEKAEAEFSPGLNVLTGETGAGKSVLMGALGLVLGGRADASIVRDGAKEAEVEADFGETVVRRTVTREGRSRAWVNDESVSIAELKELGRSLVDIHGPTANQKLMEEAFQRETLDASISESGESVKQVVLKTNHCGGILGGVSVGMPIVARLAFKPTPSISIEQDSVDLKTMTPAKITVKGRHDRCVAFRGAVAAEAAMAIVLATELFG